MKIINNSYMEARDLLDEGTQFDLLISIADAGSSCRCPEGQIFEFSDELQISDTGPNPDNMQKVALALEAFRPGPSSAIMIHCFAGVSRSSAVTLWFLLLHETYQEPEYAVDQLFEINPCAEPNALVVNFALQRLQFLGRLDATQAERVLSRLADYRRVSAIRRSMSVPLD